MKTISSRIPRTQFPSQTISAYHAYQFFTGVNLLCYTEVIDLQTLSFGKSVNTEFAMYKKK